MRTIWKGAVSFGLVSIPVKLFPATEHKDVKFRYLHRSCQAPLQYKKICVACGKEVPQEEIVRGYEYEKGRFVIINEEDLERVPDEQTKTIDIMDFVALQEIDPVYFDKAITWPRLRQEKRPMLCCVWPWRKREKLPGQDNYPN